MAIGNRHAQRRWYVLEHNGDKYEVLAYNREQARCWFRNWLNQPVTTRFIRHV